VTIPSIAALALPRSAGAVTRTFKVSPSQPAKQLREDAGTALIWSFVDTTRFDSFPVVGWRNPWQLISAA
jgi:hypothetical protein